MALWSAIYGKIWPLLRREPVPQQPCCRMTKVTISPDSMTKMTNARQTYKYDTFIPSLDQMTKAPNDNDDNIPHNHLSQSQYTDPDVGLDNVAHSLRRTLECVFASSTVQVHCNYMGTHQKLLSIAWAISGTVGVWGWGSMKFIL